jgi:hypothetical protein
MPPFLPRHLDILFGGVTIHQELAQITRTETIGRGILDLRGGCRKWNIELKRIL